MDAIPLCDIIKTYTDIYVNTQQILFNTILFYFARGDMFRLLIQMAVWAAETCRHTQNKIKLC